MVTWSWVRVRGVLRWAGRCGPGRVPGRAGVRGWRRWWFGCAWL